MAYTQASNRAVQKYSKANYDQIAIRVQKGKRDIFNQYAAFKGVSVAEMISELIEAEMQKDGWTPKQAAETTAKN